MDAIAARIDDLLRDARSGARPGAIGDEPDRPGAVISEPLQDVLVPTAPSASATAVSIDGAGFFAVERSGARSYTRLGDFRVTAGGGLVDGEGRALLGYASPRGGGDPSPIVLGARTGIAIDSKGVITADGPHGRVEVARIALAIFAAPERLKRIDPTTLGATAASGGPRFVSPGDANVGSLREHALENGFVDVEADLERLWLAQRRADSMTAAASASDSCERDALGLVH